MFQKLLVANRGEIAVRVIRACRELGVATVAVYSDADADALHVQMADESVHIGPAPSSESYLRQDRIIAAAKETGAEAVHPGYGFLSENASFARAVGEAGLAWVGPPPEAMERMGDKTRARAEAQKAGVPVAPGTEVLADADAALEAAGSIGYPVMLKAAAGGGGIGMRVVRSAKELPAQFDSATKQAAAAFGVPDVFMEKYIERPRHIEVQVLADGHDHAVHLGERECSIQRRHQKLVEEAPSPALTEEERAWIGDKAVALAKQVGYQNAGTMEFLYEEGAASDASGDASEAAGPGAGRFYFNEMNTRLQVEHPVTELVTGIDLVQWQIRIAAGERLTVQQEDVRLRGHAFEARVNAEDPLQDWMPSPGTVRALHLPQGPGIRVDGCLRDGWTVPSDYDSMVLKVLAHGTDRDEAVRRMRRALGETVVEGFATNVPFHHALFAHPAFQAGDLSTRFLEEHDLRGAIQAEADHAKMHGRRRAAAVVAALRDAPGGGLAGMQLRQHLPRVVRPVPGRRDWRPAE